MPNWRKWRNNAAMHKFSIKVILNSVNICFGWYHGLVNVAGHDRENFQPLCGTGCFGQGNRLKNLVTICNHSYHLNLLKRSQLDLVFGLFRPLGRWICQTVYTF